MTKPGRDIAAYDTTMPSGTLIDHISMCVCVCVCAAYDTTLPTRLVKMQQTLRQKTNWRRHAWRTEIRPVEHSHIYSNMDKLPLNVGGSRREADVLDIT